MKDNRQLFFIGLLGSVLSFSSFFKWMDAKDLWIELFAKEKIEQTSFNEDALCARQDGGISADISSLISIGEIALVGRKNTYKIKVSSSIVSKQFEIYVDNDLIKTIVPETNIFSFDTHHLEILREGNSIRFIINEVEEHVLESEYIADYVLEGQSSETITLKKMEFSQDCCVRKIWYLDEDGDGEGHSGFLSLSCSQPAILDLGKKRLKS